MLSVCCLRDALRCRGMLCSSTRSRHKQETMFPSLLLRGRWLSSNEGAPGGTLSATDTNETTVPCVISDPAFVHFPGNKKKASRIGFGSSWVAAPADRSLELSRALDDGRCNLVQLGSRILPGSRTDGEGNAVPPEESDMGDTNESWEARTLRNLEIPREELALVSKLEADGLSIEEALDPARAEEQLDKLLHYHGLEYLDSFVLEIPGLNGGEANVNTYRREMGLAVRRALEGIIPRTGDKITTLGFSWKNNPHVPYPGRAPDSPLSDVMELRDVVVPNKPIVAMFPIGVGCGETTDGWDTASVGCFGLSPEQGVFQIGTRVLHAQRSDGRPFRFVDVNPRPIDDIMSDLKSHFSMAVHLELEYAKRFEKQQEAGGTAEGDAAREVKEGKRGQELQGPLPEKADISWAHILMQHQHQLQGLDEWEVIRDMQIKPTINRAVQTLRAAGQAPGEWGFLYRSTLGTLLSTLTEVMQIRKRHQLDEAAALMDRLCPALPTVARGRRARNGGEDNGPSAVTIMGRCVGAALSTGVDCVLAEEFASSREAGRQRGFEKVGPDSDGLAGLYSDFKLPL